ncbi:MAG: hypothetical protein H6Q55_2514, partial [Deltaproteobacteria bacterium]|nr:hypothetical protein [Deltaproteobacteria bacterium]
REVPFDLGNEALCKVGPRRQLLLRQRLGLSQRTDPLPNARTTYFHANNIRSPKVYCFKLIEFFLGVK